MSKFIHIRSSKFPVLPGEEEELINEGTYGKSLAEYVQSKLRERGYDSPFVICEDWGWWVHLTGAPLAFGVCIYSDLDAVKRGEFVCTDSLIKSRKWSWKNLRFVDASPWAEKLHSDLMNIFQSDEDISIIEVTDEFPL